MAAAKGGQGSASLYGLITFVILFVISTVFAVVFYVKYDEAKNIAATETKSREKVASGNEMRNISKIIGTTEAGKSHLGTVVSYMDELYTAVTGQLPSEEVTAETKVKEVRNKIEETLLALDIENNPGLLALVTELKNQRDFAATSATKMRADIAALQEEWDTITANYKVGEDILIKEKLTFMTQANETQSNVDSLVGTQKQMAENTINMVKSKLQDTISNLDDTKMELNTTSELYSKSEQSRKNLESKLESIKPRPDIEVEAYKADGRIISVNLQSGVVYLNIGSKDKVYRGLTFSVYNKSAPIPADGKGKAEIKVFDIKDRVAVAKVVSESKENPIIPDDKIVNLIWDKDTPNTFVVIGEFDLDGDGSIDLDGTEKVTRLIEGWGSIVTNKIDINTDFVVVGNQPKRLSKPSDDDIMDDPMSQDKYDESVVKYNAYTDKVKQASELSIPVFNTDRFINLIGYDTEISRSKPF